jgi:hypothetical protein
MGMMSGELVAYNSTRDTVCCMAREPCLSRSEGERPGPAYRLFRTALVTARPSSS